MDAALAIRETGPNRPDPDRARRTGLVLLVASAYPECTCPDDCDRDHPNE
jgi:hypothetical protein